MQDSPTPDRRRSNRKAALLGGVVGSIGLAASLFALTATAGASGPALQTSDPEPAATVTLTDDGVVDEEAWAEYDACIDAVFKSHGFDVDEAFGEVEVLDMDEFEGGVLAGDVEFELGPAVSIMNGDNMNFAEFGEGDGSVTITKTGDDLSITSDGDVVVEEFDWDDVKMLEAEALGEGVEMLDGFNDEIFAELDSALSSCDDQLPEGVDFNHVVNEAEVVELTEAS